MTVKTELERKENNIVELSVDIPAEQASQEYNKACRRVGQRINISGFRKGKAPRAVIEKNVGKERLQQEAMDRLLPPVFADVITENELDIVAPPQVNNIEFDLEKGVKIKASIELRPEVKLPKYLDLTLDVTPYKVPDIAEEKELEALQERFTTLETVIDRAVEDKDIVNIDFNGSVAGKLIEGGSAKNYMLDLGNNNFIEGFAEQIINHKIGEEFSIDVKFPEDYHDKDIAGKDASFLIKINEIKSKKVPELNDELAAKINPDFKTLDDLKAEIHKHLRNHEEQETEFRKQKAVVDYLLSNTDITLSENMISREASILMSDVKERLKSQGHSWEQFIEAQGKDTVMANLRDDASNRIKTSLIFGAIAKKEDLAVTADEFAAQVAELSGMAGQDERAIMRQLANNPNATQSLNDQILSQKVMSLMLEKTTFNEVEGKEEEHVHGPDCNHDHGPEADATPADKAAETAAQAIAGGEEFDVIDEEK